MDEAVLKRFNHLKNLIRETRILSDEDKLDKAFELMVSSLGNSKDITGQYDINSALEVGEIAVREIGLGVTSLISIFLHKASLYQKHSHINIQKEYDDSVSVIFNGLEKITYIGYDSNQSDAENLRKLLLNLAKDVRVILICLAQQLYLMRKMKGMSRELQIRLTSDASYIYAPLAHRLGLYIIKSEMDDLYLKYSNRKTYDLIARKLSETMRTRKKFIEDFIAPIDKVLKE